MKRGLELVLIAGAALGCASLPVGALGPVGPVLASVQQAMGVRRAPVALAEQMCGPASGMCPSIAASLLAGFPGDFAERLTPEDVRQASVAREEAIRTGEPQMWTNPESGASGTIQARLAPPLVAQPEKIRALKGRIGAPPPLEALGLPYVVSGRRGANVRGGPGTDFATVESLAPGDAVTALARVRSSEWLLVGRGDTAIGYVLGSLLSPAKTPLVPVASPASPQPDVASTPAGSTEDVPVMVGGECYTTSQQVRLQDGTTQEATATSCRTPSGWSQR